MMLNKLTSLIQKYIFRNYDGFILKLKIFDQEIMLSQSLAFLLLLKISASCDHNDRYKSGMERRYK